MRTLNYLTIALLIFATFPVRAQDFRDEKNACKPYRLACMNAGFKLGDKTVGNRLIGDCMLKLIEGQSVKSVSTGKTAAPPSGADAKACQALIHHGGPSAPPDPNKK